MKKIIERTIYDTETAEEVACWSNGCSRTDFHCCQENLYRTRNGNYFIYGFGGAMSKYAEPVGTNARESGEDITPLSTDSVIQWLEEKDFPDVLEKLFPDVLKEA